MSDAAAFADVHNCHCAAARREAQRLTRLYDERLRPYDLTISQFTMLSALILGGPATVGVLAERLGVDRTTLSRNIALGEKRGLVNSGPGGDARERVVTITKVGRLKAEAALPAWRAAEEAVR